MDNEPYIPLGERVAVLETKFEAFHHELHEIKEKLDELLTLKAKGAGALALMSLVIGSGVLGLIALLINIFGKPHV